MTRDPVCGMLIEEKDAAGMAEYKGKTYYFHTTECNAAFERSPDTYVREQKKHAGEKRDGPKR